MPAINRAMLAKVCLQAATNDLLRSLTQIYQATGYMPDIRDDDLEVRIHGVRELVELLKRRRQDMVDILRDKL